MLPLSQEFLTEGLRTDNGMLSLCCVLRMRHVLNLHTTRCALPSYTAMKEVIVFEGDFLMAQPMNRFTFDGMALAFRIRDVLKPPIRILANTNLQPGMTVVDYGCGPGSYTLEAARQVGPTGRVIGIDIHPLAIAAVERKAARQKMPQVETRLVKDCKTGLPDGCADRVLMIDMIHMVVERNALLQEARRLLKPDGLLVVQVHHMPVEPIRRDLEREGFVLSDQIDNELLAALP